VRGRAALYHRVSTVDQNPHAARKELRAAASRMGLRVAVDVRSAIAEFERDLIVERTRLGLANARRAGKRLGRPPLPSPPADRVRGAKGATWVEIAERLGCTVWAARMAVRPAS
jgi:DNA invertase Pin-like site-specific DNA recombinase